MDVYSFNFKMKIMLKITSLKSLDTRTHCGWDNVKLLNWCFLKIDRWGGTQWGFQNSTRMSTDSRVVSSPLLFRSPWAFLMIFFSFQSTFADIALWATMKGRCIYKSRATSLSGRALWPFPMKHQYIPAPLLVRVPTSSSCLSSAWPGSNPSSTVQPE